MSQSYQQIVSDISSLKLGEVKLLISALERALGVQASMPLPATIIQPDPVAEPEAQTAFDVVLIAVGERRVQTIKAVREALGLGLREARDAITSLPAVLREAVPEAVATALKAELEASGVTIELK